MSRYKKALYACVAILLATGTTGQVPGQTPQEPPAKEYELRLRLKFGDFYRYRVEASGPGTRDVIEFSIEVTNVEGEFIWLLTTLEKVSTHFQRTGQRAEGEASIVDTRGNLRLSAGIPELKRDSPIRTVISFPFHKVKVGEQWGTGGGPPLLLNTLVSVSRDGDREFAVIRSEYREGVDTMKMLQTVDISTGMLEKAEFEFLHKGVLRKMNAIRLPATKSSAGGTKSGGSS